MIERAGADGSSTSRTTRPAYANLLRGAPVRGTIGAPLNDREGDVDYYRVPAGKGPRSLHARLEGIPGVDLVLELFDAQGRRVAKSDARGHGLGEWLQPTAIGPTEAYLAVREVWIDGTPPTANALDPYTLTVRWGPPQPDWELEPNDWPAGADAAAGERPRARLPGQRRGPRLVLVTPTKTGLVMGTVNAPAGVDVIVFRDEDAKKVVNRRGAGDDEQFALEGRGGQAAVHRHRAQARRKKDAKDRRCRGSTIRTSSQIAARPSVRARLSARASSRAASLAWYVRMMSAPARRIDVQRLEHDAVVVDPALLGGGLQHRVLARDVVGGDRHVELAAHLGDDVQVGEGRLHHHDVGALLDVERDLAHRLAHVGRIHLVAGAIAERGRRIDRGRGTGRSSRRRTWPSRRAGRPARSRPRPAISRRKPTKPSIIPDGATRSAPARAYDSAARPRLSSVASLSMSPFDDHAAVAVRRVLAEAGVDGQHQLGDGLLDRAQRALHDALRVPRLAADLVLLLGQAEQDHRRDAELRDLFGLAHHLVDGELKLAGQRRDLARTLLPGQTNSG